MNSIKNKIDMLMDQALQQKKMAGACIAIYQKQTLLFKGSYGYANLEQQLEMKENALFRMFSMTKPVTAVATMQLWEQGKLDLTDPIWWYLPSFRSKMVAVGDMLIPAERDITVWDLLNMTSGIPYPDCWNLSQKKMGAFYDKIYARQNTDDPVTTQEFACRVGEDVPLLFQPGAQWSYGAGADILGALIEAVAQMPFGDYLKKEIFMPLEMEDTDFYVPEEKQSRFAALYNWNDQQHALEPAQGVFLGMNDYLTKPAFESGGAGLISTLSDYAQFANMLAGRGWNAEKNVRLIGEKTWRYLTTAQLNQDQKKTVNWDSLIGYSYGNLLRVLEDPVAARTSAGIGEFGWDGWVGTYFCVDPADEVVILYLIQNCGAGISNVIRRLKAIAYGAV